MRLRYIYLFFILTGVIITGCQSDFEDDYRAGKKDVESTNVITLVTARVDGVVSLSINAPALDRFGVWIDLDGDGTRAKDGSEDVKQFNAYQEYTLSPGIRTIDLHGDVTYLGAASNELTGIDVSGNSLLTTLNVPLNRLEGINLSSNTALERLDVSGNKIAKLDVSSNMGLESLWVFNNELSALDVSNNENLTFLDVSGNNLNTLDVSSNINLSRLLAYNNQLTSIDISKNTRLNRLWLFGNPFAETEAERLVAAINNSTGGELWISDEPLDEPLTIAASTKGWVVF